MKSAPHVRKPFSGSTRSLVIALDVGTTFSGVSYAILEPGEIPKIHGLTRFPGQEHVAGNSKIPSIMYYDRNGNMMAAGAEADNSSIVAQAEDEEWLKVELFKLRLRPRTMKLDMNGMHLGPLPPGKTAVHVFGDFLRYLYRCTQTFVIDTHGNGSALWAAVEHNIQFVLSHPNGWEGAQQTKMRRAMVYAGIIADSNEGKARIRFVTEGEASLHACVLNGLAGDILASPGSKTGFLVADAGGGTLDISSYRILAQNPLIIEEIAPPDCVFAGSVFVSRRAKVFLANKLKNSKYGTPDAVDHITKKFDETTKRLFRDKKDAQFIPFGSPLDRDQNAGIRNGQLKLTGQEVAELFEPSIEAAVHSIKSQIRASQGIIKSVFLVGGYAASAYLFAQLQSRLAKYKVTVSRPDAQTSKAVADGGIGFYCDHHVSARMSKFMYGVEYLREFNPANPDHLKRKDRLCELPSGPKLLLDAFDCILSRGVKVEESTVFSRKYSTEVTSLSTLSVFEVEIWCYRGGNTIPDWIMRDREDFSTLCLVRADLSPLSGSAVAQNGKHGKTYWKIIFSVEIHFGLTEFRARIKWIDKGQTRYGPASIVYNERGHRVEEDEPDLNPDDDNTTTLAGLEHKSREPSRVRSREQAPAQPPTQPPTQPSSKRTSMWGQPAKADGVSTASIVEPPPQAPFPQVGDMSRSISTRSSAVEPRSSRRKGKERESYGANEPAPPRSHKESHGSARLADQLSSVWGQVNPQDQYSKEPTPIETPKGLFTWDPPVAGANNSDVPAYMASHQQPPPMGSVVDTVDVAPPPPVENAFEIEPAGPRSRKASKASKHQSKIPSSQRTPVQEPAQLEPEPDVPAPPGAFDSVAPIAAEPTPEPAAPETAGGWGGAATLGGKKGKKKRNQPVPEPEPEPEPPAPIEPEAPPAAPEPEPVQQHEFEDQQQTSDMPGERTAFPGAWGSGANTDVTRGGDFGDWDAEAATPSKKKKGKSAANTPARQSEVPAAGSGDVSGTWGAPPAQTVDAADNWATPAAGGKKGKKGKNTVPQTPAPEREPEREPAEADPVPEPEPEHAPPTANEAEAELLGDATGGSGAAEEQENDPWNPPMNAKEARKAKKDTKKGKGASAEPSVPATPAAENPPASGWGTGWGSAGGATEEPAPAAVEQSAPEETQPSFGGGGNSWGGGWGTAGSIKGKSNAGSKAGTTAATPNPQASPKPEQKPLESTNAGGGGGGGWGNWGSTLGSATKKLGGWGSGGFGSGGGTPANESAPPTGDLLSSEVPPAASDPLTGDADNGAGDNEVPAAAEASGPATTEATPGTTVPATPAEPEGAVAENNEGEEKKKDEEEDWGLPVKKGKGGAKKKKGKK